MLLEHLLETLARLRADVRGGQVVVPNPAPKLARRQAEELPYLVHVALGFGVKVFTSHDMELIPREKRKPAREHVKVAALREVGVVLMLHAAVIRLGHNALGLAAQPVLLGSPAPLQNLVFRRRDGFAP